MLWIKNRRPCPNCIGGRTMAHFSYCCFSFVVIRFKEYSLGCFGLARFILASLFLVVVQFLALMGSL